MLAILQTKTRQTMIHRLNTLRAHSTTAALACVFLTLLATPALFAQTTYIAFGDSITAGTGDSVPVGPDAGYPRRLEALLTNAIVINEGRESGTSLDLLEEELAGVLDLNGDVLLLMIGTNDVTAHVNGSASSLVLSDTLFNIDRIRRRAAAAGMETIHATVIPRWPEARRDPNNFSNKVFNQEVRHFAGVGGFDLVDPFERFLDEPRRYGLFYAPTTGDAVGHPSPAGYDAIAETFADVINGVDSRAPVPGLIDPNDGDKQINRRTRILVDLWDFDTGIDTSSVELLVNGAPVDVTPIVNGKRVVLNYTPPAQLLGKVVVSARASDNSNPPLTLDREIATFFTRQTRFPEGDVNRDGRVDGIDLAVLAAGFGKDRSDFGFDPDADFDQDGDIDGTDLAVLVDNFGTSL